MAAVGMLAPDASPSTNAAVAMTAMFTTKEAATLETRGGRRSRRPVVAFSPDQTNMRRPPPDPAEVKFCDPPASAKFFRPDS